MENKKNYRCSFKFEDLVHDIISLLIPMCIYDKEEELAKRIKAF